MQQSSPKLITSVRPGVYKVRSGALRKSGNPYLQLHLCSTTTTTTTKDRRGSKLGLALRGGGRLLGVGVALRCSGSRPEAGGHGLGYQRETRKRSRSPVGWASLFSHSSTLARHFVVDGVNWADGAEATQQDMAHVFKRDPVIPSSPRRFASIEPSRIFWCCCSTHCC